MTDERLEQLLGGCHELSKVIIRERIAGLERELAETKTKLDCQYEAHLKEATAHAYTTVERDRLKAKLKEESQRADGNWDALERIKSKWSADRAKLKTAVEALTDAVEHCDGWRKYQNSETAVPYFVKGLEDQMRKALAAIEGKVGK